MSRTMVRHKKEEIRLTRRQRATCVIVGLMLILPPFWALAQGQSLYSDNRGLLVFAPLMVLVGLMLMLFGIRAGKRHTPRTR